MMESSMNWPNNKEIKEIIEASSMDSIFIFFYIFILIIGFTILSVTYIYLIGKSYLLFYLYKFILVINQSYMLI